MKPTKFLTVILLVIGPSDLGSCYDGAHKFPPFGREMRSEFFFPPNYTELNHGSMGPMARVPYEALQQFRIRSEANPDQWLRHDAQLQLKETRAALAKLINADTDDVVIVPNNTSGLNAVLKSLLLAAGDRLLRWSTTYEMVQRTMDFLVDHHNGQISVEIFPVTYPISNAEIVANFEAYLDQIDNSSSPIRLASIEYITSLPAVVNPIAQLIPMLKKRNIPVLIDASHALGQVPIDVKALQPDYLVTGTKHMYVARGCSVLYVDKKNQANIHPATTSWDYAVPANFQNEFYWIGTHDNTPYMTVPAALQFRQDIGGEAAIRAYNHNLAIAGGKWLAARFGTRVMQHPEQLACMVDVELPIKNVDNPKITTPEGIIKMQTWWGEIQLAKYKSTYVTVYKHNGSWWARALPQIHNELSDFYILEEHLLAIIREELGEDPSTNSTLPFPF